MIQDVLGVDGEGYVNVDGLCAGRSSCPISIHCFNVTNKLCLYNFDYIIQVQMRAAINPTNSPPMPNTS